MGTTPPVIEASLAQHVTISHLCMQPVSVDVATGARLLGISESMLRLHMRRGDIVPGYSGTKPLFSLDDLREFFSNLPKTGRPL